MCKHCPPPLGSPSQQSPGPSTAEAPTLETHMLRSARTCRGDSVREAFENPLRCETLCVCAPGEVIGYLGVLQQVDQKVNRVFPGQGAVAIHDDVEHKLERLVDVFGIKELRRKHTKKRCVGRKRGMFHVTAEQKLQKEEQRQRRQKWFVVIRLKIATTLI